MGGKGGGGGMGTLKKKSGETYNSNFPQGRKVTEAGTEAGRKLIIIRTAGVFLRFPSLAFLCVFCGGRFYFIVFVVLRVVCLFCVLFHL